MKAKNVSCGYYCLDGWKTEEKVGTSRNFGKIKVSIPARFDFIGGWTDTPPYYFKNEAAVLNTTMLLGMASIVVTVKPSKDFRVIENGNVLTDISNHMVLSKTLAFCGLNRPDIEITIYNSIPKGSGLGGSSLLSAAILAGILGYYRGAGKFLDTLKDLIGDVLTIEQLMESGGGWQDQIGGMYPGVKLIETSPEKPDNYKISYMKDLGQLSENCLIIDSRIQRRAAIILYSIRQKYLDRDKKTIKVLKTIKDNARLGFEELNKGNVVNFSKILSESWQLVNSVESASSIGSVDMMKSVCGKDLLGIKIGGAGGGVFILTIFKEKDRRDYYKEISETVFMIAISTSRFLDQKGWFWSREINFLKLKRWTGYEDG